MQTIEVSFINRRKEKITADTISLTDAPGWLVVKNEGAVTEMIPSAIIKRLRFLTKATLRLADAEEPAIDAQEATQPKLLRLPTRREIAQHPPRHLFSPLLSQRAS